MGPAAACMGPPEPPCMPGMKPICLNMAGWGAGWGGGWGPWECAGVSVGMGGRGGATWAEIMGE